MSLLPDINFYNTAKTEGESNIGWFLKVRSVITELLGGAESFPTYTIDTGVISPAVAIFDIATEGAAATDELSQISITVGTEWAEGRIIIISINNDAQAVLLKHEGGGSGQMSFTDGVDVLLNSTKKRVVLILKGTVWEEFNFVPYGANSEAQSISASVVGSALTVGLKAKNLKFRKTDLTNGIYDNISFSDLSLIIPSGATLGTINSVESELILIAINNAGTVELVIVNIAGGNDLSETGLITTVAISAAADSNNVFYSEFARVGVPYRVVGSVKSTQATAGAWATTPSAVQGYGGQALASMSSVGYGQTEQILTGSRAFGVTYYTPPGKPIHVSVWGNASASNQDLVITINGSAFYVGAKSYAIGVQISVSGFVRGGVSYSVNGSGVSLSTWKESR
jgi:hypothetical protein